MNISTFPVVYGLDWNQDIPRQTKTIDCSDQHVSYRVSGQLVVSREY
jgi:hypothetical protein